MKIKTIVMIVAVIMVITGASVPMIASAVDETGGEKTLENVAVGPSYKVYEPSTMVESLTVKYDRGAWTLDGSPYSLTDYPDGAVVMMAVKEGMAAVLTKTSTGGSWGSMYQAGGTWYCTTFALDGDDTVTWKCSRTNFGYILSELNYEVTVSGTGAGNLGYYAAARIYIGDPDGEYIQVSTSGAAKVYDGAIDDIVGIYIQAMGTNISDKNRTNYAISDGKIWQKSTSTDADVTVLKADTAVMIDLPETIGDSRLTAVLAHRSVTYGEESIAGNLAMLVPVMLLAGLVIAIAVSMTRARYD